MSHCGRYDSSVLKLVEQRQDKMPIALYKTGNTGNFTWSAILT